jgi:Xaa-Pro aminopeptidase
MSGAPPIEKRLSALRARMEKAGLAAYVVPTADPHQSEYVPECWQRRAWLSGFTGSAGMLIVLRDDARLYTDSRYWLQAERELPEGVIALMQQGAADVPDPAPWLAGMLVSGDQVGVDPRLLTEASWRAWERALHGKGIALRAIDENLADLDWSARPALPCAPLRALGTEFTGRTSEEKIDWLRGELERAECDAHVIAALDSIAWLLNVRGADVEHNPVAIAYAIVTQRETLLFIDPAKVPAQVRTHVKHVELRPYDGFAAALAELARSGQRVWLDPDTTSHWIAAQLASGPDPARKPAHEAESPILLAKAVKNPIELAGMRACHVRDGVALVRFMRWLDESLAAGHALDEVGCAEKLEALRAEGEHFQGTSFTSISAYAAHGAIVHYRPERPHCARLQPAGLYLIDSGGQYLDGTTDVTRTLALGALRQEERMAFTLVLRGHIAVASARFPERTTGAQIDPLARRPLWDHGLDYGHGTGHGVGHFLCVHEGPQRISSHGSVPLQPGMILSNEPGYYEAGEYGIRIENLVEVVERGSGPGGRRFLGFDDLTLCPIDTRCVDPAGLNAAERSWLNAYHARVRECLTPRLEEKADRDWLEARTRPV